MKLSQIVLNIKLFNNQHRLNVSWFFFCLIIIFSIFITIVSLNFINSSSPTEVGEIHQIGNNKYKYISPLLECTSPSLGDQESINLKNQITAIITDETNKNNISDAAVYIRDLNNGPWIGINAIEKFSPASLLKVPILITYLKLAEDDSNLLQKKIQIDVIDPKALDQNIVPEKEIIGGQKYTVLELLIRMISYSDNLSANTLIKNIDDQKLNKIYSDLNISIPTGGQLENFMTVVDYASFFRILYNSSYLDRDMSELALGLLTKSSFEAGLVAGLPEGTVLAHKFGERNFEGKLQLHDCGIVYIPKNNYLICVMTRGDDLSKMEKAIQVISAETYKYYSKIYKN